jgi:arylformamidase
MLGTLIIQNQKYQFDLSKPLDISIPVEENGVKAWYLERPVFEPVKTDNFIGSVAQGAAVNFRNIFFNPHGHGTHTECVGHISQEVYSVNKHLRNYFFECRLISVHPEQVDDDRCITLEQLKPLLNEIETRALVIRTLPNAFERQKMNYSNSNPPYIDVEAVKWLVSKGVEHLILDLPSIDKEVDGGQLAGHKAFWNYPFAIRWSSTITELAYIDNSIEDGLYLLNLQFAPIENDAAPSRPVLYKITPII